MKDHCNLEVLNAATLVENTKQRFAVDRIYTYISEILIAVNPFKFIDGLYTDEKKAEYKGINWTSLEPHVYAAAEMAFKHMELQSQSQSLLVSGESGAGKTETNKQLMDYLIWRAGVDKSKSVDKNLAQQILDTNPVLEAFGNAKNSRNKNSSRFGKYVNLKFNRDLQVMGAEVRTFLLEKSRVTSASLPGERSYHIFYELIAAANKGIQLPSARHPEPNPVRSRHARSPLHHPHVAPLSGRSAGQTRAAGLKGKRADDFMYTSQSGTSVIADVDDAEVFTGVDSGLASCNFSDADRTALYEVRCTLACVEVERDRDLGSSMGTGTRVCVAC